MMIFMSGDRFSIDSDRLWFFSAALKNQLDVQHKGRLAVVTQIEWFGEKQSITVTVQYVDRPPSAVPEIVL